MKQHSGIFILLMGLVVLFIGMMLLVSSLMFSAITADSTKHQEAIGKCHQQDLAVIFDDSGYPVCVSKEVVIEHRKY